MTLRITHGISNLPKRVRIIALFFLAFMAIVTMMSEGGSMKAISASSSASSLATDPKDDVTLSAKVDSDPALSASGKTAKIVTCPRCRLNSLPLVKKFVYEHAKLFEPQLKVDFKLGEDPVLHLYEDDKEVSEVPLADYNWKQIIQKLVEFGIKPNDMTADVREALEEK